MYQAYNILLKAQGMPTYKHGVFMHDDITNLLEQE